MTDATARAIDELLPIEARTASTEQAWREPTREEAAMFYDVYKRTCAAVSGGDVLYALKHIGAKLPVAAAQKGEEG